MSRPLPHELEAALPRSPEGNLGLWLDRFLPRDPRTWSLTGEQRREALEPFARNWRSESAAEALARRTAGMIYLNGRDSLKGDPGDGPLMLRFEARQVGRAVPGLGGGTATEQGLSLDRLYGAPRLMGSGLKGLARAAAVSEPEDPWSDQAIHEVFGWGPTEDDDGCAGEVYFLDALPRGGQFSLVLDVLTPHMGPWYREEVDAPVDWLSPVPVSFLAVQGTTFVFDLVWWPPRRARGDGADAVGQRIRGASLLHLAGQALAKGLSDLGVGGKTAAGYGYFEFEPTGG